MEVLSSCLFWDKLAYSGKKVTFRLVVFSHQICQTFVPGSAKWRGPPVDPGE